MSVETLSGIKKLKLYTKNGLVSSVRVDMGRAELRPELIPVELPGDSVVARPVTVGGKEYAITCVSVGNPHCVVFCEDVDRLNLTETGPLFENNALFPDRVNTEFVEIMDRNYLKMRVWERGSGETLACGTGACASAVAAVLCGHADKDSDIRVKLPGGDLTVRYTGDAVFMTGECKKVYDGVVEI
jgi:diaminopimelate epimerase